MYEPVEDYLDDLQVTKEAISTYAAFRETRDPVEHRRFYHDAAKDLCSKFTWGGLEGNENNFETCEDCLKACRKDTTYCFDLDYRTSHQYSEVSTENTTAMHDKAQT